MDVTKVLQLLIVSACSLSVFSADRKVYGTECQTLLSSVRMEVSPALLQIICSNKNSTTLVIDCGSNIWYETVAGFCSSFDLNMGHVLVDQLLLPTTITLQLVKSGEVLDAARVAILTTENLSHYRISVWGNRNTRFVLAVTTECTPPRDEDVYGMLKNVQNTFTSKISQHLPLDHVNSQSPESIYHRGQTRPSSRETDKEIPMIPEYLRPYKLGQQTNADVLRSRYALVKVRNLQPDIPDASAEDEQTKLEIYRSKFSKTNLRQNSTFLDLQADLENSEENALTTTPESSEVAKLRWMEEKRLLFEQRMAFIRNFYPESSNTGQMDTEILSEEDANEQTNGNDPQQQAEFENLPENADLQKAPFEPYSSKDAIRQHKGVRVISLLPASELQTTDDYLNISDDHKRPSDNPPLLLNEEDTADMRPKRLNFRRLDSAVVSVKPTHDNKFEHIQVLQPSNKPVVISDKSDVLTSFPPEAAILKTAQETTKASTETDHSKPGLLDFTVSNPFPLTTIQQSVDGKGLYAVSTEPFSHAEKSFKNAQTLSESDAEIVPFSVLHSSSKTFIEPTSLPLATKSTSVENNSQTVSETLSLSSFIQKQVNSQDVKNVTENIIKDAKQNRTVHESWATLPTTVKTLTFEVSSQVHSAPHDPHNSSHITKEERLTTTLSVPTSMSLKESNKSEASISSKNVSQIATTKSPYMSVGESENDIANVSSTSISFTIRSPSRPFQKAEADNLSTKTRFRITTKSPIMPLTESEKAAATFPTTNVSFSTTIKSLSTLLAGHSNGQITSPKSLSLPLSGALTIKSNVQESLTQERYFYSAEIKSNQLPPEPLTISSKEHDLPETVTAMSLQGNDSHSPTQQTLTIKLIQMIQAVQSSVRPSLQASSKLKLNTTKNSSAPVKRESHLQEINTANGSSIQQNTTTPDPAQTSESMQLSMTSQDPMITGTSEASDDEQDDDDEMQSESFWPIVAALVIGIPAVIVIGIAITVIYRKRQTDPVKLFHRKVLKNSRNASVLTLHREAAVNQRPENIQTPPKAETTRTLRPEAGRSSRHEAVHALSPEFPYPLSMDV